MSITTFNHLVELLVRRGQRRRLAVVNGIDDHTQRAVEMALDEGIVNIIFVGGKKIISRNQAMAHYHSHIEYVPADNPDDAARRAVALCREGKADMLMKGRINTDNLLRAVLNKETGMLPKGNVLTQITMTEVPGFDRLLIFTDSAVIPFPTQEQRVAQVRYVVNAWHFMGVEEPRIALIHCSEKVDERHFPYTAGYKDIIAMAQRGDFGKCIVDGPLDIGTAVSPQALATKGRQRPPQNTLDIHPRPYGQRPTGCHDPRRPALPWRQRREQVPQHRPRSPVAAPPPISPAPYKVSIGRRAFHGL